MNVLFLTLFGSHIYGTNTPSSDLDYKGIYKAEMRDIILSRVKDSVHQSTKKGNEPNVRNTSEDVDYEYKELRRFIRDACDGQTYALDMLYAPQSLWIKTSSTWEELQARRSEFLSKNMNAFIGYIRQQTGKYAMKGTRMAAVLDTIAYLESCPPKAKLYEVWNDLPKSEFVFIKDHEVSVNYAKKTEKMLEVLGKMFPGNVFVSHPLEVLQKFEKEFGGRSRAALHNQGVDWKAVSHAYRACYQLLDIANEGTIIFPLTKADYVLKIKRGEVSYGNIVQYELPQLMDQAIDAINRSSLPEKVDYASWEDWIVYEYESDY